MHNYLLEEHHHRFAAWAAATAARASRLCRFEVCKGVAILELTGFTKEFSDPKNLPKTFDLMMQAHRHWRECAIDKASEMSLPGFTDGVAAKLINCYLKARFVCGPHCHHPSVDLIHPPIDRVLLAGLEKANFGGHRRDWTRLKKLGWSKFSSTEYEEAILLIHSVLLEDPIWKIELHWKGYQ